MWINFSLLLKSSRIHNFPQNTHTFVPSVINSATDCFTESLNRYPQKLPSLNIIIKGYTDASI